MMRSVHQNVVATVAYADIFDYPLQRTEVSRWLIGGGRLPLTLPRAVKAVGQYMVLSGRERIVKVREVRQKIALGKWTRIRRLAGMFRLVPTLTLLGVTGGLAMDNARREDDIDLFFIARPGTLWITRMMVTLLAELARVRRRPNERHVRDKICLNMFMSEDRLRLPHSEHDLFAAHEVLQMVPVWERGGAYSKFIKANAWVREFLPNAWQQKNHELRIMNHEKRQKHTPFSFIIHASLFMIQLLEPIARCIQLWYMRGKRTNEVIRSGMIRFHPRDARGWVWGKYTIRLARWNIPLDKVFYRR
jgi:hypothetical protein